MTGFFVAFKLLFIQCLNLYSIVECLKKMNVKKKLPPVAKYFIKTFLRQYAHYNESIKCYRGLIKLTPEKNFQRRVVNGSKKFN